MWIFPIKLKSHLNRFPSVTVSLIAINVVVYILTTDSLLLIQTDVLEKCAFGFGISPWIHAITSTFLHGFPLHIIANMIFLWAFGPAVEERIGGFRFLILYFASGIAGDILQAGLNFMFLGRIVPGIGASGCIMGLAGACWYLFPWSPVRIWYWFGWVWMGVVEIAVFWVVGSYWLMDLANGLIGTIQGTTGGVGHFVHLGGALAGVALCVLFRACRDPAAVSELRAVQSEMTDPERITLPILQAHLEEESGDLELVKEIADLSRQQNQSHALHNAMMTAGPDLLSTAPDLVLDYLLKRNGRLDIYPPGKLLALADRLLSSGRWGPAIGLYRRLADSHPGTPTGEIALLQFANCQWTRNGDATACERTLAELDRMYPLSLHRPRIEALRRQIRASLAS
jgi:membrane associated rhomboid family serine protease